MEVKDRILEFIRYKKIPVKQFEEKSQLSNGYVSSMRKGFGTGKLENVLNSFPELNRDWLLHGEGDMLKPKHQRNKVGINNGIVGIQGDGHHITNNDVSSMKELISPIVSLMEKKDEQITDVIGILKSKDEQINRLIDFIEYHGKQKQTT